MKKGKKITEDVRMIIMIIRLKIRQWREEITS